MKKKEALKTQPENNNENKGTFLQRLHIKVEKNWP